MSVRVYGINQVAIEVSDICKAIAFYEDVFDLTRKDDGEGDAFFQLGEHQFLAMFEVAKMTPDRTRHFGIMVRDEEQIAEVREKLILVVPTFMVGRPMIDGVGRASLSQKKWTSVACPIMVRRASPLPDRSPHRVAANAASPPT